MNDTVKEVLSQRGDRYGPFENHAAITQDLKSLIQWRLTDAGKTLRPFQQEALDMICHKIGRIVNGDPNYDDSWIDIAGYATLVVNILKKEQHMIVRNCCDGPRAISAVEGEKT